MIHVSSRVIIIPTLVYTSNSYILDSFYECFVSLLTLIVLFLIIELIITSI